MDIYYKSARCPVNVPKCFAHRHQRLEGVVVNLGASEGRGIGEAAGFPMVRTVLPALCMYAYA